MGDLCILVPFHSFLFQYVQTARKGVRTALWMATELLLLMGRNLEEISKRMISNINPHIRHTSASPWGNSVHLQQNVNRETQTSPAVSKAFLLSLSDLKSSSWCSIIHGFHGALTRHPILRPMVKTASTLFVCVTSCINKKCYCIAYAGTSEVMKVNSVFVPIGPKRTACVNVSLCWILVPLDILKIFMLAEW